MWCLCNNCYLFLFSLTILYKQLSININFVNNYLVVRRCFNISPEPYFITFPIFAFNKLGRCANFLVCCCVFHAYLIFINIIDRCTISLSFCPQPAKNICETSDCQTLNFFWIILDFLNFYQFFALSVLKKAFS